MHLGSPLPNRRPALPLSAAVTALLALFAGGCLDGQLIRADRALDTVALDSPDGETAPAKSQAKTVAAQADESDTEEATTEAPESRPVAKRPAAAKSAAALKKQTQADNAADEHEQALEAVLDELEHTGELDAGTRSLIRADLKTVEQAHWEPILQVYRGVLTRRQHAAEQAPVARLPRALPARAIGPLAVEAAAPAANSAAPELQRAAHVDVASVGPATAAAVVLASAPAAPTTAAPPAAPPTTPAVVPTAAPVAAPAKVALAMPVAHVEPIHSSPPDAADWQTHLTRAITAMEAQASAPPLSAEAANRETALRLLYLAANRKDDALRPVAGVSTAQQEFWSKELFGLATLLDSDKVADISTRASQARTHLADAALELGELATLAVRNATLCSEVKSYGVYQKFDSYEFRPGQELLLYAEVENFQSEATDNGFHTSLRSSYQILDSRGQRVANHEFAVTEDVCRSRRRDFIMRYFIYLPKQMYDGTYTLQLTIEDIQSQKVGQTALEFTIKGQP